MKTMNTPSERDRRTIIDLSVHFLTTMILAAIIVRVSSSFLYGFVCILGGIFVDLDHLIDYFLSTRKRLALKEFVTHKYLASGKIYLFLHSWEINLIILIMAISLDSALLWVLFLSLTTHLFIDSLQRENSLFYFLSYRLSKGFNFGAMLPKTRERMFKR